MRSIGYNWYDTTLLWGYVCWFALGLEVPSVARRRVPGRTQQGAIVRHFGLKGLATNPVLARLLWPRHGNILPTRFSAFTPDPIAGTPIEDYTTEGNATKALHASRSWAVMPGVRSHPQANNEDPRSRAALLVFSR